MFLKCYCGRLLYAFVNACLLLLFPISVSWRCGWNTWMCMWEGGKLSRKYSKMWSQKNAFSFFFSFIKSFLIQNIPSPKLAVNWGWYIWTWRPSSRDCGVGTEIPSTFQDWVQCLYYRSIWWLKAIFIVSETLICFIKQCFYFQICSTGLWCY